MCRLEGLPYRKQVTFTSLYKYFFLQSHVSLKKHDKKTATQLFLLHHLISWTDSDVHINVLNPELIHILSHCWHNTATSLQAEQALYLLINNIFFTFFGLKNSHKSRHFQYLYCFLMIHNLDPVIFCLDRLRDTAQWVFFLLGGNVHCVFPGKIKASRLILKCVSIQVAMCADMHVDAPHPP